MEKLYTIKEAVKLLLVSDRTIRRWIHNKEIKYVRVLRKIGIPESEIQRLRKEKK